MTDQLNMDFGHDLIDHATSDDHYTPPFIFQALNVEFDLDVAAPPNGVPWIPAKRSLSIIEDGLVSEWNGLVWCNPPFSNCRPWVDKLIKHDHAIGLFPMAKSAWFNTLWQNSTGFIALPWNTKFMRADGKSAGIMFSSVLCSFGDQARQILDQSGLGRVR